MKLEVLKNDCFYHIYNRGINGCSIFSNNENKKFFLKKLNHFANNTFKVYAYCLMDNHFHLIIKVTNETKITQQFSNMFNSYAKAYNKQESRTGSLFEKHFKRIQLKDEVYLKNLIIYVHLNPFHHLNKDYKTFQFSSFASILSDKETNLLRLEVIDLFDNIENFVYCHSSKQEFLNEIYTLE